MSCIKVWRLLARCDEPDLHEQAIGLGPKQAEPFAREGNA